MKELFLEEVMDCMVFVVGWILFIWNSGMFIDISDGMDKV